jgi:hypothetical protein
LNTEPETETRTLQSVADELSIPLEWVLEHAAGLAMWGWDDRFVDDPDGTNPPPGGTHWSGGAYWNIGTQEAWPTVEISTAMADRLIENWRRDNSTNA